jgi:cell division protein FtsX
MSKASSVVNPAERRRILWRFLLEAVIYAVLVGGYALAVFHYLGAWLKDLYDHHLHWYAGVALLLIVGQGVVLELVTNFIFRLVRKNTQ